MKCVVCGERIEIGSKKEIQVTCPKCHSCYPYKKDLIEVQFEDINLDAILIWLKFNMLFESTP